MPNRTHAAAVLPPPEEKAQFVHAMFARIAPTYDATNRVMTMDLDRTWRQRVVDAVALPVGGRALDVGSGTGDFLPLLAACARDATVVGVDFCLPMMQHGQARMAASHHTTHFVAGDALLLPFADNTFDAITTGFTLRNVTDIPAAFHEMWRVARAGGVVACLEVARPRRALPRLGHRLYFQHVVPRLGGWMSGDRRAYDYLYHSARAFPPPEHLAQMMRDVGWQHVHHTLHSLGAVAIHVGVKL